jgi:hypothetical protein
MRTVEEIEKELADAKRSELEASWKEYLGKTTLYLQSIVGKCFIKWSCNQTFSIFKVSGFKEAYTTRLGAREDWGPDRFFTVTASASITCRIADQRGNWFKPSVKFSKFKFNVVNGNEIETSELCLMDLDNEKYIRNTVMEFGRKSYNERIPFYDKELEDFKWGLREVPEEVYLEAKSIAEDNILKTKSFWDKHSTMIRKL